MKYEAEFVEGEQKCNGKGIQKLKGIANYKGEIKNFKREGKGVMHF